MEQQSSGVPTSNRRAVSIRAVLLGLLLALVLVVVTPFNDHIVNNGFMIGSFFPPVLVMAVVVLVVVNALVRGVLPRLALHRGEIAVASLIVLIACSVPGQGILRTLVPLPAMPFQMMRESNEFATAMNASGIPTYLFPVTSIATGPTEGTTVDFYARVPPDVAIPYGAWKTPILTWGALVACGALMLIGTAYATRVQWFRNERLTFPLVGVHESLIADPAPGERFASLYKSPLFWIPAISVLLLQSVIAAKPYFPRWVPPISVKYDFNAILTELPFRDLPWYTKSSTLIFMIVGLIYFVPTRASFSIWSAILVLAVLRVTHAADTGFGVPDGAVPDVHFGVALAVCGAALWLGRARYARLLRSAFLGAKRDNDDGTDPLTPGELWGVRVALLGAAGMMLWLLGVAGVTWWVGLAIIAFTWIAHLCTARVVAEVGIPFFRANANSLQFVSQLPVTTLSTRDAFFSGVGAMLGSFTARESVMVYAQHSAVMVSRDDVDRRARKAWPWLIGAVLPVVFVVGFIAALTFYYSYSSTLEAGSTSIENPVALYDLPRANLSSPVVAVQRGAWWPSAYSPVIYMFCGAVAAGVMAFGAARWSGWPFVPIGLLVATTWFGFIAWYSIMVGWLAKVLILRFGGASFYAKLRPAFIGLIVGESFAVGIWIVISSTRALMGLEYYAIRILPQ
jgi:hypothetical protein